MKLTLLPPKMEKWIFEKAYNYVVRASKVYGQGSPPNNGTWAQGSKVENQAAYEAIINDVWLYSSIYAIASSAAMLPSGVYKRGTKSSGGDYELDDDDNLTALWRKPNPIQTREEFREACFWSLELTGKLFIEVVGTKKNPKELYVLDPRRVTIIKDKTKFVAGYEYDVDGVPVPFKPEDIIFHRYHNPRDPFDGLSAATPAGSAINANILSSMYNNSFFGNSGFPGGTLETEKRMTEPEVDALRMQWEKGHKGPKKAHRVAILYGGIKFNVVQRSPKDMEFTKQKLLSREETLASFGVPPVFVGLLEKVNYGNSKEQKKLFWNITMMPKLASLAQRLTLEFGLDGFKRKFFFDVSGVDALQEDQEIRSRIAFNLFKATVMTADEIRRIFYKLPALPNGVGKEVWVPANMVPARTQMNGIQIPAVGNPGKPGKPSGPDAQPKPEGQKPGANDGKPAGKMNGNGHTIQKDAALTELIENIEEVFNDEYELNETLLIG